jgi:hypothetical protein
MKTMRGSWLHRQLGDGVLAAPLWQMDRRRFAGGLAVGAFFAMIPVPLQMLGAGVSALLARVNLPVAIAATWLSNPITTPLLVYIQYKVGCALLGRPRSEDAKLLDLLTNAPLPLIVGAAVTAVVAGVMGFALALLGWDLVTKALTRSRPRVLKS